MKMEPPPRLFSHQCPEGEQVVSANFAITEFSEVPHSPGLMLSGMHPIIPARIMALLGKALRIGTKLCFSQGRYKRSRKSLLVTVVETFRRRSPAIVVSNE